MRYRNFKNKIISLKELEKSNPAAFRMRFILWVVVGYFAILLYFLCFSLILAGLIVAHYLPVQLLIFFIVVLYTIIRIIFQKATPPEGIEVSKEAFPHLMEVVDDAKFAVNGPNIYKTLLTMDYNAAVLQIPRFSFLFGGVRNYLIIGLPLMKTLTPEELKAVLCHEFGHLSKDHSKFQQRVSKIDVIWETMASLNWWMLLGFYPFVKLYSPHIKAYIMVFQQHDEYEADAIAAKAAGSLVSARALYKIHLYGYYFEEKVQGELGKFAAREQIPLEGASKFLIEKLSLPPGDEALMKYHENITKIKTSPSDTHPSLTDRLKAIGEGISELPAEFENSLDTLISTDKREDVIMRVDAVWGKDMKDGWGILLRAGRQAVKEIEKLEKKERSEWTVDEWLKYIIDKEIFLDDSEIAELCRDVYELFPENPHVLSRYGSALLALNDDSGLEYLKQAMKDPIAAPDAAATAVDYLQLHGREEELEQLIEEIEQQESRIEKAYSKMTEFSAKDEYDKHDLDKEQMDLILDALDEFLPKMSECYLVRKTNTPPGFASLYLLAFKPKSTSFALSSEGIVEKVVEKLEHSPVPLYVINLNENRKLAKIMRQLPGADILCLSRRHKL